MSSSLKPNVKGFQQLRRSPEIKARLQRDSEAVAKAAGDGYEVRPGEGKTRSRSSVVTASADAMRAESKNNNLLRALQSRGR